MAIHLTPKIGELILESFTETSLLAKSISTLLEAVKAHALTVAANDKTLVGAVYSNSLFDDATDNIFYTVYFGRIEDKPTEYGAEIRFVHNASAQFSGLVIEPDTIQPVANETRYTRSMINNTAFPRTYTHLLKQSIIKLNTEIAAAANITDLANVAVLIK